MTGLAPLWAGLAIGCGLSVIVMALAALWVRR